MQLKLAIRLGKTLGEIQQMPVTEFALWSAYNRMSPLGDERIDVLAGQVTQAVLNAAGAKIKLDEVVIEWEQDRPEDKVVDMHKFMKGIMRQQRGE